MLTQQEPSDPEPDPHSTWRERLQRLLVDEPFQQRLRRLALRRLGGSANVEDVLQEVWLKLLRKPPPEARGDGATRAYVESAVSGTAINCRKKLARSAGWSSDVESVEGTWEVRDLVVPEAVLKDLAPLLEQLAASTAKSRARRRSLQQLLEVLRRHELISDVTYEAVRRHRPDLRVRHRTATSAAPRRAMAS